jgi:hypothetical protein
MSYGSEKSSGSVSESESSSGPSSSLGYLCDWDIINIVTHDDTGDDDVSFGRYRVVNNSDETLVIISASTTVPGDTNLSGWPIVDPNSFEDFEWQSVDEQGVLGPSFEGYTFTVVTEHCGSRTVTWPAPTV